MAEWDIQKRMELKELVSNLALLEKDTPSLCKYIFSNKGYDEIKNLYIMHEEAVQLHQNKKTDEIQRKIDTYAYLAAGLMLRLKSDSELMGHVASEVPEFKSVFGKLSNWVSENEIDKSLLKYMAYIENNKDELEKRFKDDPLVQMLKEKYGAEKR